MLMCVGAGIAVENILNIHQAGEHRTCFYLNFDGYSFYRIVTNMKFMLMYVCVCEWNMLGVAQCQLS